MVLPFFCGSAVISSTRPTTTGPSMSAPGASSASSLSPSAVSRWARSTGGHVVRQVDVLADPGQRGAHGHQISVPKGGVKRTSPSTMSRMSETPCRNISVRSRPMPNAKPV